MNTLIQANIFFFITSIAVVIFLILGVVACIYLIGFLRNIKRASDLLTHKIELASEHADTLFEDIRESAIFSFLFGKKRRKK